MNYLVRQVCTWCFLMTVPNDLRQVVSKTKLRHTIGSGNKPKAKAKSKRISQQVKKRFKELRMEKDTEGVCLNQTEINNLIREFVKETLANMFASMNCHLQP